LIERELVGHKFHPWELFLVTHHHLHGSVVFGVGMVRASKEKNILGGQMAVDIDCDFTGIDKIGSLQVSPPPP
jgi:hypothetical protein